MFDVLVNVIEFGWLCVKGIIVGLFIVWLMGVIASLILEYVSFIQFRKDKKRIEKMMDEVDERIKNVIKSRD